MLRELGQSGAISLLQLWLYAATNRPDGVLTDMDAEDIEECASWSKRRGQFFDYLTRNRWLDEAGNGLWKLHEWEIHQQWAAEAETREEDARFAAHIRHHENRGVSRRKTCPYCADPHLAAMRRNASSNAGSSAGGIPRGNAPSPDPTPDPSPVPFPKPVPLKAGERTGAATAVNRARDAKAKRIAKWCRDNRALRCLTCAHAPHLTSQCANCDCDGSDTTIRPEFRGAFETEFQIPWAAWTEQRAEMETSLIEREQVEAL